MHPVAEDDPLFRIVDAAGRLSPELLEQVDPEFATAVHGGLLWEILSYSIEDEEPDGCAVIQAALNAKNGLFMVCHEMQALSRLMTLTSSSAVAERSLKWEYVLRRMRETMPQFADDPNVLDLYAFVVDMGADKSSFMHDLRDFHLKFVNPKLRRLRLCAFAQSNSLPLEMPHLKIASLKYLYVHGKLSHGFCGILTSKVVKQLSSSAEGQSASAVAEDILRFFHVNCRSAIVTLDEGMKVKFFGNFDKDVFAQLLIQDSPGVHESPVRACGLNYYKRLQRMCPGCEIPSFPLAQSSSAVAESRSTKTAEGMHPRIIEYDATGRPLTKQDEMQARSRTEVFAWSSFMATSCMVDALEETVIKCFILGHLHMLHQQLPTIIQGYVQVVKEGTRGSGVRVMSLKAWEVGALRMAPLVTGATCLSRVSKVAVAPHVLKVRVCIGGAKTDWWLSGSGALPQPSAAVEECNMM